MATYAWPSANPKHMPQTAALRVIANSRHNMSAESGVSQTVTRPGTRWGWSLTMPPMLTAARDDFEGWLVSLQGMQHRISTWDWKRPRPRGTCNLAGVTVAAPAAALATQVQLAGCGSGRTLLRGDWVGFSTGQLCRVTADAASDAGGAMTLNFVPELRAPLGTGAGVVLDRPTALYILTEPQIELPRRPGPVQPSFGLDLVEVFA
jgi:hypothetical protein